MSYTLTEKDYAIIVAQNRRNGWGFSKEMLLRIEREHKKARKAGDERRAAMLEERLTDANFHTECAYLSDGDYEGYKRCVLASFEH